MNSSDIRDYWRNPGEENDPHTYGRLLIGRSIFLLDKMREHANENDRVLELGCNVGRNLAFLHHGGFKNLNGVEINPEAVRLMPEIFPELKRVQVIVSSIEEFLSGTPDNAFDVVFSMAVLEHIHPDSDWVFREIARITPKIIVIEDEFTESERHFVRSYGEIFVGLGYTESDYLEKVPGLPRTFRYRLLERPMSVRNSDITLR